MYTFENELPKYVIMKRHTALQKIYKIYMLGKMICEREGGENIGIKGLGLFLDV